METPNQNQNDNEPTKLEMPPVTPEQAMREALGARQITIDLHHIIRPYLRGDKRLPAPVIIGALEVLKAAVMEEFVARSKHSAMAEAMGKVMEHISSMGSAIEKAGEQETAAPETEPPSQSVTE